MRKRLLSIVATMAMVVAMVPAMAFADTITDWSNANSLPKDTGSYKLTTDVTITSTVEIPNSKTITLDLNGKTVTFEGSAYYYVREKANLVIKDSVGTGKITNAGSTYSSNYVLQIRGNCEINGGTIENTVSSGRAAYIYNGSPTATLTLNGGTILNSYDKGAKAVVVGNNAKFVMNGGTVESKATGTGGETSAIQGGVLEIAGGKIVTPGTAIESTNDVKVTGGTIEAGTYAFKTKNLVVEPADGKTVNVKAGKAAFNPYLNNSNNNSIKGGNFDAPILSKPCEYDDSVVGVTGGTFTNGNEVMDVEEFISGDLEQDENGKVVEPAPATSNPAPSTPAEKPEASPKTGDNSVAPFAVAGLVMAVMAAVVATRRRTN